MYDQSKLELASSLVPVIPKVKSTAHVKSSPPFKDPYLQLNWECSKKNLFFFLKVYEKLSVYEQEERVLESSEF